MNTLSQLLAVNSEKIISEAVAGLNRCALCHYRKQPETEIRERMSLLFSETVECIKDKTLIPINLYAQKLAAERFREGFFLQEIQTAFNVLEETLWEIVTKNMQPAEYPDAFGLISSVMGAGKEALAVEYVSLVTGSPKKPAADITRLFQGT